MTSISFPSAAVAFVLLLAGCGQGPNIEIKDGRVTLPPPGVSMSAGYFTLENGTGQPLEVQAITSPSFGAIEMHETTTQNGVSSMHRLDTLTVPPHDHVSFGPGGKHLMMFRPQGPMESGSRVAVAFKLAGADGAVQTLEATFVAAEPGQTD